MVGRRPFTTYVLFLASTPIISTGRPAGSWTWLAKGYGSFQSAWRTLEGIETMNMIRKGRVRRVAKGNVVAEAQFIVMLFAIAA
jgi:hypothetical protein